MLRVIVIGTGTGVGKTYVSTALARSLQLIVQGPIVALKPVETGVARGAATDAGALAMAGSPEASPGAPRYAFTPAVSPHIAARQSTTSISVAAIAQWVESATHSALHRTTLHYHARGVTFESLPHEERPAGVCVIETAGGLLSPLTDIETNFELARALDPAVWVLVAPDRLGVLHDVRATWEAARARGRTPDHLVLSAPEAPDESTGTNAVELPRLGLPPPQAVVRRGHPEDVAPLVRALQHATA